MRKLFDIERGNVVMNPTSLWIPEFKKLWDRDKSEGKEIATKEISYVVFMNSFQSPYSAYSDKIKKEKVLGDYFNDMPDWKPDKAVLAAEKKLKELQDTIALRLLRSSKKSLELIESFTDAVSQKIINGDIDIADSDKVIDRIVKNAKEVGNLVTSLDKLEKLVQKEQHENNAKGDKEIGDFEL